MQGQMYERARTFNNAEHLIIRTFNIMQGQTYERAAIEAWLKDHETDPFSGKGIGKALIPNVLVRKLLENMGHV